MKIRRNKRGVPFIKTEEYDFIALEILNSVGLNTFDINNIKAIDIENIIEIKYGINLEYENIIDDKTVHGMIVFGNPTLIKIEEMLCEEKYINRLRFTLAHELSHYLLHSEVNINNVNSTTLFKCKEKNIANYNELDNMIKGEQEWIEYQADCLAASILMPLLQIKYIIENKQTKDIVKFISEIFKVSEKSAEVRYKKIKEVMYNNKNQLTLF